MNSFGSLRFWNNTFTSRLLLRKKLERWENKVPKKFKVCRKEFLLGCYNIFQKIGLF